MSSSAIDEALVPVHVSVDDEMIRVRFRAGKEIATPVAHFPRLQSADPSSRTRWQLIGKGYGIHWPDVDEDITVNGLLERAVPSSDTRIEQLPQLIGDLLRTTRRLNELFEGRRPFTPDGHLVGSIGEVVAEYVYDLDLLPPSSQHCDAKTKDNRTVQIKLTGERGTSYGFRWSNLAPPQTPDLLICLKLTEKGFEEVYSGRFPKELLEVKRDHKNGQISLRIPELRALKDERLVRVRSFDSINRWFTPAELADVA